MIFLTIKITTDIILLSTVVIKPILCKGGCDVIKHTKANIDIDVKVYPDTWFTDRPRILLAEPHSN